MVVLVSVLYLVCWKVESSVGTFVFNFMTRVKFNFVLLNFNLSTCCYLRSYVCVCVKVLKVQLVQVVLVFLVFFMSSNY